MPIGYLVSTGLMATFVFAAVARHRPRRSSPFRLSYFFGFLFNWPAFAFFLLVASTALAVAQTGSAPSSFGLGSDSPSSPRPDLSSCVGGSWGQARRLNAPWTWASGPAGVKTWTLSSPFGSAAGPRWAASS